MSNPTTPFSWQMPQATDLVTDLPADFEVFGQAVATSMQDLLGGTTGQVLAKASNADMDFVWSADAAGMTNPMTTTGDTIYSSSGSTPARLGIGTTGQLLTVAGGVPTWAAPAAAGGITLISTTSFSGATFSLTSIPTTYKYLKLVLVDVATTSENDATIRFNNDSGTNYDSAWWRQTTTLGATNYQSATSFSAGTIATGDANKVFSYILDIPNYTSTGTKPFFSSGWGANAANARNGISFGRYRGSSAITRIDVIIGAGTYSAGTAFLYGES